MKKITTIFLYPLMLLGLVFNAFQLEGSNATFQRMGGDALVIQSNSYSDTHYHFFTVLEELEIQENEENETDSSKTHSYLNTTASKSTASNTPFIPLQETTAALTLKKALYIWYSSLKIPFL